MRPSLSRCSPSGQAQLNRGEPGPRAGVGRHRKEQRPPGPSQRLGPGGRAQVRGVWSGPWGNLESQGCLWGIFGWLWVFWGCQGYFGGILGDPRGILGEFWGVLPAGCLPGCSTTMASGLKSSWATTWGAGEPPWSRMATRDPREESVQKAQSWRKGHGGSQKGLLGDEGGHWRLGGNGRFRRTLGGPEGHREGQGGRGQKGLWGDIGEARGGPGGLTWKTARPRGCARCWGSLRCVWRPLPSRATLDTVWRRPSAQYRRWEDWSGGNRGVRGALRGQGVTGGTWGNIGVRGDTGLGTYKGTQYRH